MFGQIEMSRIVFGQSKLAFDQILVSQIVFGQIKLALAIFQYTEWFLANPN